MLQVNLLVASFCSMRTSQRHLLRFHSFLFVFERQNEGASNLLSTYPQFSLSFAVVFYLCLFNLKYKCNKYKIKGQSMILWVCICYMHIPDFHAKGMMPFSLFHTLHGEATCVSGSTSTLLCESPNQCSVITCTRSHYLL